MEDDFRPQVKKVTVAMGASLTEQDIDHMPPELKTQGDAQCLCVSDVVMHSCYQFDESRLSSLPDVISQGTSTTAGSWTTCGSSRPQSKERRP